MRKTIVLKMMQQVLTKEEQMQVIARARRINQLRDQAHRTANAPPCMTAHTTKKQAK